MSKTTVDNLVSEIKGGPIDYDITDTDLDTFIIRSINRTIKRIKGLLKDYGFTQDITASASFKTVDSQSYKDITQAMIVGDATSFTGAAGDKIDVTIDGTDYTDIDLSSCTDIADVVTAINTAVGSTVASENGGGHLVITSPTSGSGSTSNVTIDDDGAASGAVDSLFSDEDERTSTGINDLDEILKLTERTNDNPIDIVPYDELIANQPDPTSSESATPREAARHNNRVYFRPTPSKSIYIYIDYYKLISDVSSGDTMPFEDKFDTLIMAMVNLDLTRYLDSTNAVSIGDYKDEINTLKDELIISAAKNITESNQVGSRRSTDDFFSPRKPLS